MTAQRSEEHWLLLSKCSDLPHNAGPNSDPNPVYPDSDNVNYIDSGIECLLNVN